MTRKYLALSSLFYTLLVNSVFVVALIPLKLHDIVAEDSLLFGKGSAAKSHRLIIHELERKMGLKVSSRGIVASDGE